MKRNLNLKEMLQDGVGLEVKKMAWVKWSLL
jgi:hypothetical protein